MAGRWRRFRSWLNRANPGPDTLAAIGRAWLWAAAVLTLLTALTLGSQTLSLYGSLGVLAIFGLLLLIALGTWLVLLLLMKLPGSVRAGLLLLAVPLVPVALGTPLLFAALYLFLALAIGLVGTGLARYRRQQRISAVSLAGVGSLSLAAAVVVFLISGWEPEHASDWPPMQAKQLNLPNPGLPGSFPVLTYSYGSGTDKNRLEFAAEADWQTRSVDGSKLIDGWEGPAGWARTGFWGLDDSALPVQGRVWMPDGQGPFPLVLIVHGNHEGPDFSDVGYGYLGELFASRGMITVSVDENFLNSFMGDFLGGPDGGLEEESDARGWMLLQHLVQWREWSADAGHPMFGKVDLERVVLIGHSRGGEAVSEAAFFNRLPRYPDDGTLEFDFGFGIKGIVAVAPVDSQYNPRDRATELEDLNLLVIHGSHDSDVDAFVGSAMYSRLEFRNCMECFKSSLYLVGANHGQFNSSWGRYDTVFPAAGLLNVAPLMDPEVQREVARVMFSAFLEVTLSGRSEYQRFLARPESGARWFPDGVSYLTNYADARMIRLVDFEEDGDLLSAGEQVAQISADDLALWKESEVPLRWRDTDSAAVLLGWGDEIVSVPVYEVQLIDGGLAASPEMTLSFSVAMATEAPEGVEDFEVPETLDFEIELLDVAGQSARVSLSTRRALRPQVDPLLYKLEALSESQASEPTFQRYVFAFAEWQADNQALDLAALQTIRFLFPAEVPASVWLDDLVISPDGY